MAAASGGSSKAFFTNVDAGGTFHVQFNPKEFKLDEKASWKASDEHEHDKPLLTYEKGEPTTVSMDLIFDSSDTGSNVYDTYVKQLRSFLTSYIVITDPEGDVSKRPPYVTFTWGSFNFDCIVEKVGATFLMFKPDGTPIRAKVSIGLKERARPSFQTGTNQQLTLSAMGTMFTGGAGNSSTYTVQEGDTVTGIAAQTGSSANDIAVANNISDPMNPTPGQELVIPANSELAAVLAAQSLGDQAGNWAGNPAIQDALGSLGGGALDGAPSSFEDLNDLGVDFTSAAGSGFGGLT